MSDLKKLSSTKDKKSLSEKTTSSLRILQIEKSIRSISSILDTRTIFTLQEVIGAHDRNDRFDRKLKLRRENGGQNIILNQGQDIAEILKERGIHVPDLPDEFEDEERIWKSKSRAPTYTQKRKFENPQLHNFFLSLNEQQQKDFYIACRDALFELSQKTRSSVQTVKDSFDDRCIFHSQANAHRAHCLYLLKINTSTIEDPVLKDMMRNDPAWDSADLTETASSKLRTENSKINRATTSSRNKERDPIHAKAPVAAHIESGERLMSMFSEKEVVPPPPSGSVVTHSEIGEDDNVKKIIPFRQSKETNQSKSETNTTTSGDTAKVGSIVKDLRPSSAREESALGLEDFMDDQNSAWMLQKLQKDQLDAMISGVYHHSSKPIANATSNMLSWRLLPALEESVTAPLVTDETGFFDINEPTKILSFNDFQTLFQSYNIDESAAYNQESDSKGHGEAARVENEYLLQPGVVNDDSLPPIVTNKLTKQGAINTVFKDKAAKNKFNSAIQDSYGISAIEGGDKSSEKLLESMQPHLDAYINMKAKKQNTISTKFLSAVGDTKPGNHISIMMENRKKNSSRIGYDAVKAVSQSKKTLTKLHPSPADRIHTSDGFRNVFKDLEESDDDMTSSLSSEVNLDNGQEKEKQLSVENKDDVDQPENMNKNYSRVYRRNNPGRKTRNLNGKSNIAAAKGDDVAATQQMQTDIWEILQVDTINRIAMMQKYSSDEWSSVFLPALLAWGEIAALVSCRKCLKNLVHHEQKGNTESIPSNLEAASSWLRQNLIQCIPSSILNTLNDQLISPRGDMKGIVHKVSDIISSSDPMLLHDNYNQFYPLAYLLDVARRMDFALLVILEKVETQYQDVVPFGSTSTCKEWVYLKKFPTLKSDNK